MLKRGFSLLELVIAIGVLAIGLIGVLQLFPMGLRASQRAGMISKATFLAQRKMEDIRLAGFDAFSSNPPLIALSGTDGDFDWQILIEEPDLSGVKNTQDIRKVVLRINWSERDRIRSKDFVTYVAK